MIQHARELISMRFDTPDQAFLTRNLSQRIGSVLAAVAFTLRLSPNAVTMIGLVCMLLGAWTYAACSGLVGALLPAVLWQLGFGFDCADGQLARATQRQSAFGGWLDVACDHIRQGAICLALTILLPTAMGYVSAVILLAGLSVYLHTVMAIKIAAPPPLQLSQGANVVRFALREFLDTPMFLAALCIFRTWPMLLMIYCAVFGLLLLARALSLARFRLSQA